jgi:cytochrome P450
VTETAEGMYGGTIFEEMGAATGRHPQRTYASLRAIAPVQRVGDAVVVTSRAAIDVVFRHPEIYSSRMEPGRHGNVRSLIPLEVDPPVHKKYRKIMDPLFAPQRMQRLAEPIERLVNDLIDDFIDEPEIDFAQRFSIPFPSQVFLTLFGLPLEETTRFVAMKDGINRPFHVIGRPMNDPETVAYRDSVAHELYDYFEDILDERAQGPKDDLLSHFLSAEVDGHRLTREDILDICFLFFIAGLDTVSASLECFFAYLAEHPDMRAQLVADPASIPRAVEELLRWESPVMLVSRVATKDAELAGCPVHAGDEIYAFVGSANTDDNEAPDADTVRLDRATNPHIAFGGGVHRCLGSHLARLELRTALRVWHARIPHYRIRPGHEFTYTIGIRAIDSFPMLLGEMN